jgi:hypothetical protein
MEEEKAKELVLKFLRIENNTPEWFNTHIAKQCALIAADEILKELESIDDGQTVIPYNYWQEVKNEINNL